MLRVGGRRNIIVAREKKALISVISTLHRSLSIVLLYTENNDKKNDMIQLSTPFTSQVQSLQMFAHTHTHFIKVNHTNAIFIQQ